MGQLGIDKEKDIAAIRYIAPIVPGGFIYGYYKVSKTNIAQLDNVKYPVRIKFDVCDWVALEKPARFGMVKAAFRGMYKSQSEFIKHCKEQAVEDFN